MAVRAGGCPEVGEGFAHATVESGHSSSGSGGIIHVQLCKNLYTSVNGDTSEGFNLLGSERNEI
jgi:hypothetical protein